MNGLPYYKAYPRDFIEGTIGMPFEVKCAYRVVLDLIYLQGGELPDDPRYISGNLGCSLRKWKSIRQKLIELGKIEVSGEFLTNKRAHNELETLTKYRENQAENARKPKKNKDLQKPTQGQRALYTEPEPEPYTPPNPQGGNDFDEFWQEVPKKVNKGQAKKAYRAALKKTDSKTLLEGMKEYAESVKGREQQYVAHPSTWLNGERWLDEKPKDTRTFRDKPQSEWTAKDREQAAMQWL